MSKKYYEGSTWIERCPVCDNLTLKPYWTRFSDAWYCESCDEQFSDALLCESYPEKFGEIHYENIQQLDVLRYVPPGKADKVIVLFSGYGQSARQTFTKSRWMRYLLNNNTICYFVAPQSKDWYKFSEMVYIKILFGKISEFHSDKPLFCVGFSQGGMMVAERLVYTNITSYIFISGFVKPAVNIIEQLANDNVDVLKSRDIVIVDNLRDTMVVSNSGTDFHVQNQVMRVYLDNHQVPFTLYGVDGLHAIHYCREEIFNHMRNIIS